MTGKSTYIVSLPKSWITERGLKAGDEVSIQRQGDSSLLILPSLPRRLERAGEVEIRLSPNENPNSIVRKVVSMYLIGYNLIRLIAAEGRISPSQREIIKRFIRTKLVGTEITTDLPSEITLQVLLSYPELSVKDALKRMCLIVKSMRKDAMTALGNFDRGLARDVVMMDDEVDRFGMYVIRQLKSAVEDPRLIKEVGLSTARDCLGYRVVAKSVERIADHVAMIAQNILQLKKPVKTALLKKIISMDNFAAKSFENAVESLFKEDYNSAEKVIERGEAIRKLEERVVQTMLKKASREDVATLRLITESLRRISEYSTDISEVVLNLTAVKSIGHLESGGPSEALRV